MFAFIAYVPGLSNWEHTKMSRHRHHHVLFVSTWLNDWQQKVSRENAGCDNTAKKQAGLK